MNRLEKINELIEKYGLKNNTRKRDVLFKRYFVYNELRIYGLSLSSTFKRIQRRVKMGFYEKNSTFVGDRAADTVETDQKVGE
jgi:hypothetical protein